MNSPTPTRQRAMAAALFLILALPTGVQAQFGRGAAPAPVPGRDGAPFDLTGYWTALITDDWQYRMITPVAGDYSYIPLNDEGRRVADEWNSAADETAGEECKAYAAPAIMRLPTRLRIAWENDNTLRIDTDLGMQTRMFHFEGLKRVPANQPGRDSLKRPGKSKVARVDRYSVPSRSTPTICDRATCARTAFHSAETPS